MARVERHKVLITGAAGGMGRACARLFGMTRDLVLTDVAAEPLATFAAELERDGFTVAAALAGDLGDADLLATLTGQVAGAPFVLLHTAGLSPALAEWEAIMRVNLVTTTKLLDAIEPVLEPGSVAVVIASIAGHMTPPIPDADAVLRDPLADGFLPHIGAIVQAMAGQGGPGGAEGISYSLSKQATIALCERRASAWGQRGARIVSISPGMILTPMGRQEIEKTPGAAQTAEFAPAGRAGVASDIAAAALFLASDQASYITGCDLRVDGGTVAAVRAMMG